MIVRAYLESARTAVPHVCGAVVFKAPESSDNKKLLELAVAQLMKDAPALSNRNDTRLWVMKHFRTVRG